jgi:hypothetical protein
MVGLKIADLQRLIAHEAFSLLGHPQISEPLTAKGRLLHPPSSAVLEVFFPFWVVRIGVRFNLLMTFDRDLCRELDCAIHRLSALVDLFGFDCERPTSISDAVEVSLRYPRCGFLWMPPSCPLPQTEPNLRVHIREGLLRHDMSMVSTPSIYYRIQDLYHGFLLYLLTF